MRLSQVEYDLIKEFYGAYLSFFQSILFVDVCIREEWRKEGWPPLIIGYVREVSRANYYYR